MWVTFGKIKVLLLVRRFNVRGGGKDINLQEMRLLGGEDMLYEIDGLVIIESFITN